MVENPVVPAFWEKNSQFTHTSQKSLYWHTNTDSFVCLHTEQFQGWPVSMRTSLLGSEVNCLFWVWRRSPAVWCWRPSAAPAVSGLVGTGTRCAWRQSSWCARSLWTRPGFVERNLVSPDRHAGTAGTEPAPASAAYYAATFVPTETRRRAFTKGAGRYADMSLYVLWHPPETNGPTGPIYRYNTNECQEICAPVMSEGTRDGPQSSPLTSSVSELWLADVCRKENTHTTFIFPTFIVLNLLILWSNLLPRQHVTLDLCYCYYTGVQCHTMDVKGLKNDVKY